MFQFDPISTTNIISIVQIVIAIAGFYFSWKSLEATRKSVDTATKSLNVASENLKLATSNAQAQLYNQMVSQGRDLNWKFMDVFHSPDDPKSIPQKQQLYTGMVLAYYAACFELRNVLQMPGIINKLLDSELEYLLKQPFVKARWEEQKSSFSRAFIDHVNGLGGVR